MALVDHTHRDDHVLELENLGLEHHVLIDYLLMTELAESRTASDWRFLRNCSKFHIGDGLLFRFGSRVRSNFNVAILPRSSTCDSLCWRPVEETNTAADFLRSRQLSGLLSRFPVARHHFKRPLTVG